MQNPATAGAMFPTLAHLQREVQAMSRRVHRQAVLRTLDGVDDYDGNVSAVLSNILDEGDAYEKVVCFASAAEFGIPMHHHSEPCRMAALHTGSSAMRVLYWTAIRRMGSNWSTSQPKPGHRAGPRRSLIAQATIQTRMPPEAVPCEQCDAQRIDSRNSHGHDGLHPTSEAYFRWIGGGVQVEVIEHQCQTCSTTWARHKSAANLFVSWSIAAPSSWLETGWLDRCRLSAQMPSDGVHQ